MIPVLLLSAVLSLQAQDTTRLTVTVAIDRALATHPAVASARAQRDVATAEVGQARAAWLPGVSLDGAINRFEKPMVVYPLHSLDLRNPPQFDRSLSQASVGAAYTLLDFGARSSKVKAAELQRDAATATLGAAEALLVARTASAFLRVLTARGILAAEDQRLAALAAEVGRARSRLSAGKAARLDTLRAAAELASASADRLTSAANVTIAEHELARLTGVAVEAVRGARLADVRLAGAAAALGSTGTNADVQAAEYRAGAATAAVNAARASLYPTVQATSAIIDRSNVTGRYLSEWQVGVAFSYPLFTGGARSSIIGRAEAGARVAQEQVRLARFTAEQAVDETEATFDGARSRVTALEAAVEQSAEVARITQLARDVGEGTQTDYLIAEANLFRARSSLVQARHAVIAARVELARVLGELSRPWIASSLESLP
ncbi:MAG TPA: TolC family protein [Gemmatimonadaceae bacterium]